MKLAQIAWMLVLTAGGEHERGLQLLREGRYAEAAAAFRNAIDDGGATAELSYNLALALWKAGMYDQAETAAEQAATLSNGAMSTLRDGLLGNLRYAQAQAARAEDPQGALGLAEQARGHYLRGAVRADATPEVARNLERAQVLIEELKKEIEEQEKQEQDKQDQDKQDQDKQDQEKQDQDKQDEQQDGEKQDQKQDDQQKDDQNKDPKQGEDQQQKPGEGEQPEPQPEEPKPDEEKPDEQKPEDEQKQQQEKQQPAPGEQQEQHELTPEEKKRLMDKLQEIEQTLQELRARQKAMRPVVEKDW